MLRFSIFYIAAQRVRCRDRIEFSRANEQMKGKLRGTLTVENAFRIRRFSAVCTIATAPQRTAPSSIMHGAASVCLWLYSYATIDCTCTPQAGRRPDREHRGSVDVPPLPAARSDLI
jgi:hypothetical protein